MVQSSEANGASRSGQYSYDVRGRLTAQQTVYHANANSTTADSGSYSYDAAGHLNAGANGWQYNANGQLTSAPPVAGTPGATGLSYDASGHLTGFNGLALSYDTWGRLAQVANTPSGTVSYFYDSSGRRACKQVGNVKTFYLYDGSDLIAETDASGNLTRSYVWGALGLISDYTPQQGGNGFGLHAPQSEWRQDWFSLPGRRHSAWMQCQAGSGRNRYYAFDPEGNLSSLVGEGGLPYRYGCYSPFGSAELARQLQQEAFGYKGQSGAYHDSETIGMVSERGQAYVPAAPTYTAPMGAGGQGGPAYLPMGGNPVAGSPVDDEEEDFPLNPDGSAKVYGEVRRGLHTLANHMEAGLDFAADFNPIYQVGAIVTGRTASGHKLSPGERLFRLGLLVAPAALHHIAENAEGLLCRLGRGECFVAGTLVWTAWQDSAGVWHSAVKPIEQVRQGEYVVTRNPQTGATEYKQVLSTSCTEADVVLAVTLADAKTGQAVETLTATRLHPFAVEGKGFVPAGGLAVGNSIVTRAGPALVVKDVQWLRRPEGYSVYNFEVEMTIPTSLVTLLMECGCIMQGAVLHPPCRHWI